MTAPRNIVTQWSGGDTVAEVELPECEIGDQLFIFVGGGNHVVGTPAGWFWDDYLTGQEAQGIVYHKIAEAGDSGSTVNVTFDGTDQRYIAAVASRDYYAFVGNYAARAGTAGSTFPATTHGWTADAYQGDLVFTFAFVRNGATAPTLDRGVLWDSQASAGSSAALYIESAPAYEEDSAWELSLPSRSGFIVYQFAVYQRVWTDWVQDPDYTDDVIGFSSFADIQGRGGSDSRSQIGSFPTITQDDFLDLPLDWQSGDLGPVHWTYDGVIDGGEYSISWSVNQAFRFYGYRIPAANRQPVPDDLPPDAVNWEYVADGSALIGLESEVYTTDSDYDETTGTVLSVQSPSFETVVVPIDSMEWDTPTDEGLADDWAGVLGEAGAPMYARPHTPPDDAVEDATPVSVDLTDAIRDPDIAEVQFAYYVKGTPEPSVDLRSYTNAGAGAAAFGAALRFASYVGTFRPPLRRDEVRRGPIVPIGPITVVRQYPRGDGLGMSSAPRLYPPPKSQRVYGGHQ